MNKTQAIPVIFVTGLSGAGRSTTLKVLEDIGFEVFDNIPLHVMGSLLKADDDIKRLAIGIDTRTRYFSVPGLLEEIEAINASPSNASQAYSAKLLFMDCDEAVLQSRFSETRRRHPMAKDRTVADGIKAEKSMLKPLKTKADYLIDTSSYSVHDLRDDLSNKFADGHMQDLAVTIKSFGFKNGLPRDLDMVFDVRFLKNPHWESGLKPLTGQNEKVGDYIETDPDFAAFWQHLEAMVSLLLPRYQEEGKSYLTIGFGCTGGKHRSVYLTEKLGAILKQRGVNVHLRHRDMPV